MASLGEPWMGKAWNGSRGTIGHGSRGEARHGAAWHGWQGKAAMAGPGMVGWAGRGAARRAANLWRARMHAEVTSDKAIEIQPENEAEAAVMRSHEWTVTVQRRELYSLGGDKIKLVPKERPPTDG